MIVSHTSFGVPLFIDVYNAFYQVCIKLCSKLGKTSFEMHDIMNILGRRHFNKPHTVFKVLKQTSMED
jgi:hypothetical protein